MTLASIPSPTTAVWDLGPIPIRAYAIFIVLGIVVACVVTELRLRARGAPKYAVLDLAVWAVPFGIVGARLYHVITSPDLFFGPAGNPMDILRIWQGGLGVWGGIAGGAVGVWLACRQLKLPFLMVADASAVGIPLAQAIGRLGNWFNNELYGSQTTLPWGLEVYEMRDGQAIPDPQTGEVVPLAGLYHPTFLYEALWCVGVAVLVWLVGRQLRLGRGRQFALYVMGYTAGRAWIEMLRIDGTDAAPVFDNQQTMMLLGQRINVWVAVLLFIAALIYLVRTRGSQEYLVPAGEDGGYRVVTEPEYREYQATAGAQAADSEEATAGDQPAAGESGEDGANGAAEPAPAAEPAGSPDVEASGPERPTATRTRDDD